jgi:hypothetical protein
MLLRDAAVVNDAVVNDAVADGGGTRRQSTTTAAAVKSGLHASRWGFTGAAEAK